MTSRRVAIGPWAGGLNVSEDTQLIRDNELINAVNIIVRDDGSIINRPGMKAQIASNVTVVDPASGINSAIPTNTNAQGDRFDVLGFFNGDTWLVGKAQWNNTSKLWETIKVYKVTAASMRATWGNVSHTDYWVDTGFVAGADYFVKAVAYVSDLYLVPNSSTTTMKKFAGSAISLNLATATTITVPKGLLYFPFYAQYGTSPSVDLCFIWKDRLWICCSDRIYYSKATDFSVWAAPDGGFFDVGIDSSSDSNIITAVTLTGNTLHIFKPNSTFTFTFQVDPATDGYLSTVSSQQGATSCVQWRNRVFTTDNKGIYEYASGQFISISRKLDFVNTLRVYNLTSMNEVGFVGSTMHVMNNYLVVGPFNGIGGNLSRVSGIYFAMNLNNGAWFKWVTYCEGVGHAGASAENYYGHPISGNILGDGSNTDYLGVSAKGSSLVFMSFGVPSQAPALDYIIPATNAAPVARCPNFSWITKNYTFDSNMAFKKIHKILIDRGYTPDFGTGIVGGFSVSYTVPSDLPFRSSGPGTHQTQAVNAQLTETFGSLVASGSFRCLDFQIEFLYNHGVTTMPDLMGRLFYTNGIYVNISSKPSKDYGNVTTVD